MLSLSMSSSVLLFPFPPVAVPWAENTACVSAAGKLTFTSVVPPTRYLYLDRDARRPPGRFEQPNPPVCSCRSLRAVCWLGLSENTARLSRDCCRESSQQKGSRPSRSRTRSASPEQPELPRRSRRDSSHAPGPAPLRRGRPARRREEVDPGHDPGHGAREGRAAPADGSQKGPEGAREAE